MPFILFLSLLTLVEAQPQQTAARRDELAAQRAEREATHAKTQLRNVNAFYARIVGELQRGQHARSTQLPAQSKAGKLLALTKQQQRAAAHDVAHAKQQILALQQRRDKLRSDAATLAQDNELRQLDLLETREAVHTAFVISHSHTRFSPPVSLSSPNN
jgi:hypothetical protein